MDTQRLTGTHIAGVGKAHLNIGSAKKRAEHTDIFGCPMVGTFNIALALGGWIQCKPYRTHGADSYWLVRLRTGGREVYAYAVRWLGSQMPQDRMELLSRRPIPEHFKAGEFEITIFERWSPEQIKAWQAGLDDRTKWQGHAFWQPQRADSAFVWDRIGVDRGYDFSGKTVLDIGCNAGYFAFRAAQRGAVVMAQDKNENILGVARTIQHHIEMTDVEFDRMDVPDLVEGYDYVFYFSVHHQFDPAYDRLDNTLKGIRCQNGTLFLELINPPLSGNLSKEAVDDIVRKHGGRELVHYRHQVRRMRSLYVL